LKARDVQAGDYCSLVHIRVEEVMVEGDMVAIMWDPESGRQMSIHEAERELNVFPSICPGCGLNILEEARQ